MTDIDLLDAKNYINSIDFTGVIDRMVKRKGWLRKDANLACRLYRNYLFLMKKYGQEYVLPPSQDIDDFWHNHILDTEKYQTDCQAIFGKFLHHDPDLKQLSGSSAKAKSAFSVMLDLYSREFGETLFGIRGRLKKIINCLRCL